jgi:hypothetical protein
MWMKDQSKTCAQEISLGTPSPTFSLVSGDGPTLSGWLDGMIDDLFGPGAVLANLSPRQAKEKGLLTSGTYGPRGFTLSGRVALRESLGSKLQALCNGSTLYKTTWKRKRTALGTPYWAHTASVPRTSASASTGWATPAAQEPGGTPEQHLARKRAAVAAGAKMGATAVTTLSHQAQLTGWATPTSRDHKDGAMQEVDVPIKGLLGRQVTLSSAATASAGQLNPEFSRWLMGFPKAWTNCAPSKWLDGKR